jgi:hypothetical protein
MMGFKIDNSIDGRPAERRLQEKLSELIPLKHFIITGFARNGLFLLIKALRWDSSAEIIVPAYTCSIIKHAVEEAGVTPVPVDAEDEGINIDPEKIIKAITPRTKAIYVVHTYGVAAQIDKICEIAKLHNCLVIEDLAHAPFSFYRGKQLGTYGDFALFSFIKKNINYEGGAIGTNNTSIYAKMVMLQREYERKRPHSLSVFLDNAVRLVGAWWESGFSLTSLFWMKFNDFLNVLLYKGVYGIKIDEIRFFASIRSCEKTIRQLDDLYKKYRENKTGYLKYKDRVPGIRMYDIPQSESDTLPFYYTGAVPGNNRFFKLLSFRTWRNSNEPGIYPRADYLYTHYRVFSRAILLFRNRRNGRRHAA